MPQDVLFGSPRLSVDPVHPGCKGVSLYRLLPKESWDRLRKEVYQRAGHRCEICGRRRQMACHEVWSYDGAARVQKLMGLMALCPQCHEVKHFWFTRARGTARAAFGHLARVNGWTAEEALAYLDWLLYIGFPKRGDRKSWTLDLSWLEKWYE